MTQQKTKRTLLFSIVSLVICITMLVGATFAWFTDSASTSVNTIKAGTLDIALEMYQDGKWVPAEGKTLDFIKADGSEEVLWEPGCTYELPLLRVTNKGLLAFKYQIIITGINGDAKLNEVIDWTIDNAEMGTTYHLLPGATTEVGIRGHMQEDAGNEYQGLSIDGISITVIATQDTVETDSTNSTYDANSTYAPAWDGTVDEAGLLANTDAQAKTVKIYSAAQLAAFAQSVGPEQSYAGYTVSLMSPIDLANLEWTPIGAETMDGYPGCAFQGTFNGNGLPIRNLKVTAKGENATAALFGSASKATIKNVVIEGANIHSEHYAAGILAYETAASTLINCQVKNATIISTVVNNNNGDKVGGIVGYMGGAGTLQACSVADSTIIAYRDAGAVIGCTGSGLTVIDCRAENVTVIQDASVDYKDETPTTLGEIVGRDGGAILLHNTVLNVTVKLNGNVVNVTESIAANNVLTKELGDSYVNLNGNELNQSTTTTVNNGSIVIANGTVVNGGSNKYADIRPTEGQKVNATYENVSFVSTYKNKTYGPSTDRFTEMVKVTPKNGQADFSFVNCTFDQASVSLGGLSGYNGEVTLTFKGCNFRGLGTGPIVEVGNYLNVTILFENCTFDIEATGYFAVVSGMASSDVTVVANNNQLNGTVAVATTDPALAGTVDQIKVSNPSVKFVGLNIDSFAGNGNIYTGIATEQ